MILYDKKIEPTLVSVNFVFAAEERTVFSIRRGTRLFLTEKKECIIFIVYW